MTNNLDHWYARLTSQIVMVTVVIEMTCVVRTAPIGCTWRSSVSATLPEQQTISPQSDCPQGQLVWHNPRGDLTATFSHQYGQQDFTLCVLLSPAHNDTLTGVYDVTSGDPQRLDIDFDDVPVCVNSVSKQVVLRFDATLNMDSLSVIDYYKDQAT